MTVPQPKPYDDKERLKELYWHAGMTQKQIADLFGTSRASIYRAMKRNGIEARERKYKGEPATLRTLQGYQCWDGSHSTVYVHQLLAIAEEEDPHKVFSGGDYVVHHKNGVKWDNRPENIELLSVEEHGRLHGNERKDVVAEWGKEKKYTDGEMLGWIESFVEMNGFVPKKMDVKGWPGPSMYTYRYRFGSFLEAVEEAGFTPRGRDA